MTSREDKIIIAENGIITEEALLAYLHDKLSPEDRHELERLLKDDPFAQDALEGLKSAQNKAGLADSLSSIRTKVRERVDGKERKIIRLHWANYAWAAVILGLLISLGSIMVVYLGKRSDNVATADQPSPTTITAPEKEETQTKTPDTSTLNDSTTQPVQQQDENKAPVTVPGEDKKEKTPIVQNNGSNMAPSGGTINGTTSPIVNNPKASDVNKPVTTDKDLLAAKERGKEKAEKTVTPPKTEGTTAVTVEEAKKTFYAADYKKSAEQFDELLKTNPDNPEVLFFGGVSNYVNKDYKKSEKNFDQLLKQKKKFVDGAKWYKANILLTKGDKDQAKKIFEELSETNGSYKERAKKKLTETQF